MKLFFTCILVLGVLPMYSQSYKFDDYNLTIIDSCFSKVDSSYKLIHIQFLNGSDKNFEKMFIDTLKTLKYIDYFLYPYSPDEGRFREVKGISISIYYESKSCLITSGNFLSDPLTFETTKIITSDDLSCCWTFYAGEPVLPCK